MWTFWLIERFERDCFFVALTFSVEARSCDVELIRQAIGLRSVDAKRFKIKVGINIFFRNGRNLIRWNMWISRHLHNKKMAICFLCVKKTSSQRNPIFWGLDHYHYKFVSETFNVSSQSRLKMSLHHLKNPRLTKHVHVNQMNSNFMAQRLSWTRHFDSRINFTTQRTFGCQNQFQLNNMVKLRMIPRARQLLRSCFAELSYIGNNESTKH